eukprot:scaffold17311_cov16-Tisochrysis_lutea.AAC.4
MQEAPSSSATAATHTGGPPTPHLHYQQEDGEHRSSTGVRPRSLDSAAKESAAKEKGSTGGVSPASSSSAAAAAAADAAGSPLMNIEGAADHQPQPQQQQLLGGQGSRRSQMAASWDLGTSPGSATAAAAAAAAVGGGWGGDAVRHGQSTSYDTFGMNDITLAPPPLYTLTTGAEAASSAATARGRHRNGRPEQPGVGDCAGGEVSMRDEHGDVFMTHNPLAHMPARTDPSQETFGHSDGDGQGDEGGQGAGQEGVDGQAAAELAEAVAAVNREHAESTGMVRGEESTEDAMSGRLSVVEEDESVMSGRVTVEEEDMMSGR